MAYESSTPISSDLLAADALNKGGGVDGSEVDRREGPEVYRPQGLAGGGLRLLRLLGSENPRQGWWD